MKRKNHSQLGSKKIVNANTISTSKSLIFNMFNFLK
jgi:hypothetical protein